MNLFYEMSQQLIIDDANYIIKKGINNSPSFITVFEQFRKTRNFGALAKINNDLFNELIRIYNQYILGNGLFVKRFFRFTFDEYQSFCFNILTRNVQKYSNLWYTYISNYIFVRFDEDITSIQLEELKHIDCYYSENLPRKIKKTVTAPPKISLTEIEIKDIDKLIKIGKSIKYNCKGFFNNELLYLLCGLCINEGIKRMKNNCFNAFSQLFKFVKSYLQLWQFNKVFELPQEEFHLVTHIKHNGNYVKRYKLCQKYFDNYDTKNPPNKTKYIIDKNKDSIYIETNLNRQQINDTWVVLEELYKTNDILGLYYHYVTSQLLTRSSCLSGLIILQILYYNQHNKFIRTNNEEQLDWFAISVDVNTFKENVWNYCTEFDTELSDVNCSKVSDILNYTHYYIASNLNRG